MPIINESTFKPSIFFRNPHLQTIIPNILRKVKFQFHKMVRIKTRDNDFLDLDLAYYKKKNTSIIILSHGTEGFSKRSYMKGMAKIFLNNGWDVVAWNLRGCSNETNHQKRSYTADHYYDLEDVVNFCLKNNNYKEIAFVSFSLSANITIKYLRNEKRKSVLNKIVGAIVYSAPCHLESTSINLGKKSNYIYEQRFLRKLHKKLDEKLKKFPSLVDVKPKKMTKSFRDFEEKYAVTINKFKNLEDYYTKGSCLQDLKHIKTPVLMISSKDDPILGKFSFPYEEARNHKYLFLETPEYGGHNGFMQHFKNGYYWSEIRALSFLGSRNTTS